jgi:CCR4-NOT transcription complex subunit 6
VGRQRKYTPSQDDVGFVLKYEVALVDAMHPYIDAGGWRGLEGLCFSFMYT